MKRTMIVVFIALDTGIVIWNVEHWLPAFSYQ